VPIEKAAYWEGKPLSDAALLAFPMANTELQESSNCYALGRNTAAVFHAMRAAEIGLWAVARALNVTLSYPNELAQWLTLIQQIESKITVLQQSLSKGTAKDEELAFYGDAAIHFLCFKDAYRSRTAHARASFDETKALSVLKHSSEFFEALSK